LLDQPAPDALGSNVIAALSYSPTMLAAKAVTATIPIVDDQFDFL
jgi:hypothetical protein